MSDIPVSIVITAAGSENDTSQAQLLVNGVPYLASMESSGLDNPSGLIVFINTPPYLFTTFDPMPFQDASGNNLQAIDGQAYCLTNATSSQIRFTINTGSGPMAPIAITPSMVYVQPGQTVSFVFLAQASAAQPTLVSNGCPALPTWTFAPLAPPPPNPSPLGPPLPLPLGPAPSDTEPWLIIGGVAAGVVVFVILITLLVKRLQKAQQ